MTGIFDFRGFEAMYDEWEEGYRSGAGPGEFSYRRGGPTSLYGTTDMVFSRYILGRMPNEGDRDAWSAVINGFQDSRTGWYRKRYTLHFRSHTAAYAVAALTLLGRVPAYPVRETYRVSRDRRAVERWLASVPWSLIWPGSHVVAGLPAIRLMTRTPDDGTAEFLERWRGWLDGRVHPETGFWSRGLLQKLGLRGTLTKEEMGGAFHMYFIYEAAGWPWPLPEKIVDATLELQRDNGFWDADVSYCIDLDGIYCLTRSSRNAGGYRAKDVEAACRRYLERAEATLNDRDFLFARYDNSHRLPGALAAVAECALFFPEMIRTETPWRQSLDAACFI